ncbi:MAG: MFS transporter [Verrucomicrobiota bacterium]|nr:MFS transporter [Verrucomicrobiota bacterium]
MESLAVRHSKMGRALFWTSCLSEPLFILYGLVAFILYKDLGATPFQIALLTCCKPLVTILSFYWSSCVTSTLKKNVVLAGLLMRLPFLLCPWIDTPWFLIGAAVNYMFFFRAAIPGWMEMVRKNVRQESRGKLFSWSSALGYLEGTVLTIALGGVLDRDPSLWKLLFFASALLGLIVVAIQSRIPVDEEPPPQKRALSLKELLIRPWRDSLRLLQNRPDFARYQWGFMIYGFGIMFIQPALPLLVVDHLGLSYTALTVGISLAKGMGFALSSPLWSKGLERFHFFKLSSLVFFIVGMFPIFLAGSLWGISWFYLAYFLYGIGQGGSHLITHMAGPHFAAQEESSRYTGVTIALGGVRGAIAPPLGSVCALFLGPIAALLVGGSFCFSSALFLLRKRKRASLFTSR